MKSEIEVKFLDVDVEDIRRRLRSVGAELDQPMRLMKRALIEEPHHEKENSFIRIRDEGDKTTLTFKRRSLPDESTTIDSTKEIETTVGDFDTTVEIFAEAGWRYITLQESRRETWHCDGAEVVIDEWPWIEPYIEIEAETATIVETVAKKLGFDWKNAVFGSVDVVYQRDFPHMSVRGIIDVKDARFGDPVPATFLG
jgi:adenylate cyclase class 2